MEAKTVENPYSRKTFIGNNSGSTKSLLATWVSGYRGSNAATTIFVT